MWIFLNNAFLSIVAPTPDTDADKQDMLVVRARFEGDIQRVFPNVKVTQDSGRDYRFRALVPRGAVVNAMADKVQGIDYTNFKDSCGAVNHWRHLLYLRVWHILHTAQTDRVRPSKRRKHKARNLAPHDVGAAYGSMNNHDELERWFDEQERVWRRSYP